MLKLYAIAIWDAPAIWEVWGGRQKQRLLCLCRAQSVFALIPLFQEFHLKLFEKRQIESLVCLDPHELHDVQQDQVQSPAVV